MSKRKRFIHCSFSAEDLSRIPPDDLAFLLACAHICNEIVSIALYHIFEDSTKQVVAQRFRNDRHLVLIRHVLLKLYEFQQTYHEYISSLRERRMLEEVVELKQIFGDHISEINKMDIAEFRNAIGGHFSLKRIISILNSRMAGDSEELSMTFSDKMGEVYFEFADDILMAYFGNKAGQGDLEKGIEKILDFSLFSRFKLAKACYIYIDNVFEKYGVKLNKQHQFVPKEMVVPPGSMVIPLFLESSGDELA